MPDQYEQDEALEEIFDEWAEKLLKIVETKGHDLNGEERKTLADLERPICKVAIKCEIKPDALNDIMERDTTGKVLEPYMLFSFWPWGRAEQEDKETVHQTSPPPEEEEDAVSGSVLSAEEINPEIFVTQWNADVQLAENLLPEKEKEEAPEIVHDASLETVKLLYSVVSVRLMDMAGPVIKRCMGPWYLPDRLSDPIKNRVCRLGKKLVLAVPDLLMKKISTKEVLAKLASDTVLMLFEQADESDLDVQNVLGTVSKNVSFEDVAAMNKIFTRVSSKALNIVGEELKKDEVCRERYRDLMVGLKDLALINTEVGTESTAGTIE